MRKYKNYGSYISAPTQALIFARVSSREQELGQSIDAQLSGLRTCCDINGWTVIKEFAVTESSTRGERKKFKEMLDFAAKQKTKIIIVADCIDRIQRGFKETIELSDLVNKGKIEIFFRREALRINQNSKSCDVIRWDYGVLAAKSYVGNLRDNVIRSMEYNWANGRWQNLAPLGYLNVVNRSTNEKDVILDEERAPLIKKMFQEFATGKHTLKSICKWARINGLKTRGNANTASKNLSRATIYEILNNPFYYGIMCVKGNLSPHKHPKLIDKELFELVQCKLKRKSYKATKSLYGELPFIFRGIFTCSTCGCIMSPETKIKPNGKKYTYLKCSHSRGPCNQKTVNEEVIKKQLQEEVLDKLKIPEGMLEPLKSEIIERLKIEANFSKCTEKNIKAKLEKLRQQQDRLLDLLIAGTIDEGTYNMKKAMIKESIDDLEKELSKYVNFDDSLEEAVSNVLNMADVASKVLDSPNFEEKRRVLSFLLSDSKIKDKSACFCLKKPFDLLVKSNGCMSWQPQPDSNWCSRLERAVS